MKKELSVGMGLLLTALSARDGVGSPRMGLHSRSESLVRFCMYSSSLGSRLDPPAATAQYHTTTQMGERERTSHALVGNSNTFYCQIQINIEIVFWLLAILTLSPTRKSASRSAQAIHASIPDQSVANQLCPVFMSDCAVNSKHMSSHGFAVDDAVCQGRSWFATDGAALEVRIARALLHVLVLVGLEVGSASGHCTISHNNTKGGEKENVAFISWKVIANFTVKFN